MPQDLVEHLQKHPSFVESYKPNEVSILFVFRLPKNASKYTASILAGKYSEADRTIVDKYMPKDPSHFRYGNRLVIERDQRWRDYWEERIGTSLPEGAEVYPRPLPKKELYGYVPNEQEPGHAGWQWTPTTPVG